MAATNLPVSVTLGDLVDAIRLTAGPGDVKTTDEQFIGRARTLSVDDRSKSVSEIAERFMHSTQEDILPFLERCLALLRELTTDIYRRPPLIGWGHAYADPKLLEWLEHCVLSYTNEEYESMEGEEYFMGWIIGASVLRIVEICQQPAA